MTTQERTHHQVTGKELTRRNVEAAIARATMPVHFVECDLQNVDLTRLDLTGFTFDRCNLIEADISHSTAASTTWTGCRARRMSARGVDLTDAVFKSGDWNNAVWTGAMLAGTSYTGVKLTGGDFTNAKTLGISFEDCPMVSCDIRGVSFRKSRPGRCDLSNANVCGIDFRDAVFGEGSSLANARILDARFDGADLRNVDLAGHGLDAIAILKGARITIAQAAAMITGAGLKVG